MNSQSYCDDSLLPVDYCLIGALCFKNEFQKLIKRALIEGGYPASANIWIKKSNPIERASDIFALASRFVTIQHKLCKDGGLKPGRDYWSLLKRLEMEGECYFFLD
jgi:hypothetical protein